MSLLGIMNGAQKVGVSFGLTSGVITTLGVIVGLDSATSTRLAVIAGILTIAISDAFSDALGVHVAQESSVRISHAHVWEATIFTFLSKLVVALTFLIPAIVLPLNVAVTVDLAWGFILIVGFNYHLARSRGESVAKTIGEHLGIAVLVVVITYYLGKLIGAWF